MENLYNLAHQKIRSTLASPLQSSSYAMEGNDFWAEDMEGKARHCWGLPDWFFRHYPMCPDPVADHTRSLLWRKGRVGVSLPVHLARELEWWGRRSVRLSNDKSLVAGGEAGPHLPQLLAVLCPCPSAAPKLPSSITRQEAKSSISGRKTES